MDNLDSFKQFVRSNPNFASYIKDGSMTWQKFYEIYDIYGEDKDAWSPYLKTSTKSAGNFTDILNGIDSASIQKHINTAQKAIGVVQELVGKGKTTSGISNIAKGPLNPRPINKFFED